MSNYGKFVELRKELEALGHVVILPEPAICVHEKEIELGSYVDTYKLKLKYDYIRKHFANIMISDCVLVANYDKNSVKNYIGGNSFLEIGFAYFINKPTFLLNPIPKIDYYYHEIKAMKPMVIRGNLKRIVDPIWIWGSGVGK